MPKQRNPFLFGDNSNEANRIRQLDMDISNMERAPIRVPTTRINIDIKKPKKPFNPTIPQYGPVGSLGGIGVMIALTDFTSVYILRYDGAWSLVTTVTTPLLDGASGGFNSTPEWALKTPTGKYLFNMDIFADSYPYFSFISEDGITWTPINEDVDLWNDNGAAEGVDGTIWTFRYSADNFVRIYKDGVVSYTAPDDDVGLGFQYDLEHIDSHPTDANIIAVAGWRFFNQSGTIDDYTEPWVVVTNDGGSSWISTILPDDRMSVQQSFNTQTLRFLPNGRLVFLTLHETVGPAETGPDGIRIWYADAPYSSWTMVNESSLWDYPTDDDWEGGPLNGAITGTENALFFVGHAAVGLVDVPRAFMSNNAAANWVEIQAPPVKFNGLCYDEIADVLYGLVHHVSVGGSILYRMLNAASGTGTWEDVTSGIPVGGDLFPYIKQAIWRV